MDIEITHV